MRLQVRPAGRPRQLHRPAAVLVAPRIPVGGVGIEAARPLLKDVEFAGDAYEVAKDADALVLVTEWDEFRALDLKRLAGLMRGKALIDLRNIYEADEVTRVGLSYRGIGVLAATAD